MDANVLIDFLEMDDDIYWLITEHIGLLRVPEPVLHEVDGLNAQQCEKRKIEIVQASIEQMQFAAQRVGRLSAQDNLCLKLCVDHQWTCVTNDKALRRACKAQGVPVHWGLELLVILVKHGVLEPGRANAVGTYIHTKNHHFLTHALLLDFREKIGVHKES